MKCFDYEIEKDTAGQSIMGRKCYCGTTTCQNWGKKALGMYHPVGKFPFTIILDNGKSIINTN